MTAGALLLLEVNLRLPEGSNIISMAKSTLGLPGQIIAWITYLCLLYTLLSAYIAGGSDVFAGLLHKIHIHLPNQVVCILFTLLFGLIVYQGIRSVDYVNRSLMFGKLGVYLLLIAIISPHVSTTLLRGGEVKTFASSIMILIASFSFASIIPSLRDYFKEDITSLRRVILLGSIIPLVCYIAWNAVIMGVISREGDQGLISLMHSEHVTSGLIDALNQSISNQWIQGFFSFFSSICMITAFLAVSLGLFDFLADGLQFKKSGMQGHYILALTFLPPLAVVLINPGIYLHAFSYAGTWCVILLLLLPVAMSWRGRKLALSADSSTHYVLPGGTISLGIMGFIALGLLILTLFY